MNSSIPISVLMFLGILIVSISSIQQLSFGQGLGFDESRSVLVDNKRISISLDMNPVFLTEDDKVGSASIRLREINNDNTVPHVTLNVKIIRAGEILLDDKFHSHDGIIAMRFEHVNNERMEVYGNRESLYNALNVNFDNPALVKGKVLVGGLYHYKFTVLSMWEYENKLEEPLEFDLFASMGKTSHYEVVDAEDNKQMLFIKTYYDEISDLSYDSSERKITFRMPLEWNVNYLSQIPFIHQEVQIPNNFAGLMSNSYIGTINGVEVSNRELLLDDYSYENTRTVHFIVGKDRLIRIAQNQKPEQNVSVFTLMPRDVPKFPLEILSAKENYLLQISWSPGVIEPGKPTKFIVTLRDPITLDTLKHSSADLVIFKDGKEIVRKHHKAPIGAIVQDHTFTEEQTGTILLLIENINNTGESAPLLITVVPEFPLGPFVILLATVSTVIVITRYRSMNFHQIRK